MNLRDFLLSFFRIPVFIILAGSGSERLPAAEGSVRPEWSLPGSPTFRDNGVRGEVVLNGQWGRIALTKEDWSFVPGNAVITVPGKLAEGETKKPKPEPVEQILWREVTLPEAWAGRQLAMEIGGLTAPGELWIEGKKVADLPARKRFLEFPLPSDLTLGKPLRMEIRTAGVVGDDIWLRSYPAEAGQVTIGDTYLMTFWRGREVVLRASGKATPDTGVDLIIAVREASGKPPVMEWQVRTKADTQGNWAVETKQPWPENIKAWSPENPHLYVYEVEANAAGKKADRILPRRFGFREVWIEDGQFVIDGVQTNFQCDSWFNYVPTKPAYNASRVHAERVMKNHSDNNLRYAGGMLSIDTLRDIADEIGLVGFVPAGSLVRLNIWDPRNGLTSMTGDEQMDDIERLVKRTRESPSVLFYVSSSGYSQASMHPQWAGRKSETWNFFPLNRSIEEARHAQMLFKQAKEHIAGLDPSRTVNSHNGPFTDVDMTTRYLCNNLDRQEMADFVEDWAKAMEKNAIVSSEVHIPFTGEFFLREIDFVLPQSKGIRPKIFAEMGARYDGEEAYAMTPDSDLREWAKTSSYDSRANPVFQKTTSDNIRDIFRVWRAYGINMATHHIQSEDAFPPLKENRQAARRYEKPVLEDPRVKGVAEIRNSWWPLKGEDPMWPVGETYFATFAPRILFFGGPDGPSDKTHLYYAGAPVIKSVVFVNDREKPAELSGKWALTGKDGKVFAEGTISHVVAPGKRALDEIGVTFTAPEVKQRTEFTLAVSLKARDDEKTYEDAMMITVFPPHEPKPPAFSGTVWMLNISDDRTHETPHFRINRENAELLTKAGLKPQLVKGLKTFQFLDVSLDGARALDTSRELVTEGTPAPGDLLVIPRHTLESGHDERQLNIRLLNGMDLDSLVAAGLRVLILEHNMENILGVNTENVRPRHAFIAAKGHPAFNGLENSDLANWGGQSNLQTAMTPIAPSDDRFPERVWQTSNRNSVATRTLIRPQVGAFRALAVSGFDLQESPLMEAAMGRGRLIFCQFDVTNRYGTDPAATRLMDNILAYAMTAPEPDPLKGDVRVVTAEAPGITIVENPLRLAKPEGSAGWGITAGELFVRESIYKRHWGGEPDRKIPVFSDKGSAPEVIREKDGRLETTLSKDLMETEWGRRKVAWVQAALRINQGGSSPKGPGIALQGNALSLYPHAWVENFVHPYTANIW